MPQKNIVTILLLLCIIPFVGVVSGIILLILGFVKYKRGYYVMAGILGVLLSMFVGLYLIYRLGQTASSQKAFAQLSLKQLNAVIPYIEFYKLKNNDYPTSLEQLSKADSSVFPLIQDPLLIWNNAKGTTNFYYKQMGDTYTLFSAGIDMMPGTKDDIYPILTIDSSKTGFRK
jgi:hypothetical protein